MTKNLWKNIQNITGNIFKLALSDYKKKPQQQIVPLCGHKYFTGLNGSKPERCPPEKVSNCFEKLHVSPQLSNLNVQSHTTPHSILANIRGILSLMWICMPTSITLILFNLLFTYALLMENADYYQNKTDILPKALLIT